MKSLIIVFLLLSNTGFTVCGQNITGKEVIDKSIHYHDPKGLLTSTKIEFQLSEERPSGSDRKTTVVIDTDGEFIYITSERQERSVGMTWDEGEATFSLDGSSNYSEEEATTFQLNKERLVKMKDYYRYLWHLPTTLMDEGTIIDDNVSSVDFFGNDLLQVKVSYTPKVGTDIWYFYFDPTTYALRGYRFYHDEDANDGEYILLSEEVSHKSLRLPARREWYTHKDGKYLGADVLTAITN